MITRASLLLVLLLPVFALQSAWLETHSSRSQLRAGQTARLRCEAFDGLNRKLSLTTWIQQGKTKLSSKLFSTQKPGTYELSCCASQAGRSWCDPTPLSLWVRPAAPHSLSLKLSKAAGTPSRWQRPGRRIQMRWSLLDRFGNRIHHPIPQIRVRRASHVNLALGGALGPYGMFVSKGPLFRREGPSLILLREGHFVVEARVSSHGRVLKAQAPLWIDGNGPTLKLQSPSSGIHHPMARPLEIRGKVSDGQSGVARVTVNGQPVSLDAQGRFRANMRCSWGLALVSVVAWDKAGNPNQIQRSFFCSFHSKYLPSTKPQKQPLDSLIVRIQQKALDDGERSSLNDLASLFQKAFNRVKIDALLPPTLAKGKTRVGFIKVKFVVQKAGAFKLGPRTFSFRLLERGIAVEGRFYSMEMPLKLRVGIFRQQPKVMLPWFSFRLQLGIDLKNGELALNIMRWHTDATQLRIQGLKGAAALARVVIEREIRKQLQKGAQKIIKARAFPLLRKFLVSFQLKKQWRLPKALGHRVLRFHSQASKIQITPKDLLFSLRAGVQAQRPSSQGLLYPMATLNGHWPTAGLITAISLNSINGVFRALWESGALAYDLTAVLREKMPQIPGLPFRLPTPSLSLKMGLPPLLMPGNTESSFRLGLGGLSLKWRLADEKGVPFAVDARIHVVVSFRFQFTPKGMRLILAPRPDTLSIHIERLAGIPWAQPAEVSAGIESLVHKIMPRVVLEVLKHLPMPGKKAIRLPGKLRKWMPPFHILPRLIALRSGYLVVALDLR